MTQYIPRDVRLRALIIKKRKNCSLADAYRYMARDAEIGGAIENMASFKFPVFAQSNLPPLKFKQNKKRRKKWQHKM